MTEYYEKHLWMLMHIVCKIFKCDHWADQSDSLKNQNGDQSEVYQASYLKLT